MNIVDAQTNVINAIKALGYTNVKDSLLLGLTENETYPVVIVDLDLSSVLSLASGKFTPDCHNLSLSCYDKASLGISTARQSAITTLNAILSSLNYPIIENMVKFTDTVISGIKLCAAGCIIEVSAY